jgi:hypothetical protein
MGAALAMTAALLLGCGSKKVPVTELAVYLAKQSANTDATPHTVAIANANISSEWGKINSAVKEGGRYVILDLSACIANGNTASDDMNIIKANDLVKGIILPSTLTAIGDAAFASCENLTSITIPNSVTSIGGAAFSNSGLTSVTIPNGVTRIDVAAFAICHNLTSVTLPNSLTSIGYEAFERCRSLTSITIPASVTSIGYEAFAGSGLTSVTFAEGSNIVDFGDAAFSPYYSNDLRAAYQAGGAGTYTLSGDNWTKQQG